MKSKHPTPWKVLPAGQDVKIIDGDYSGEYSAEDDCIVDANGEEVVGCSEWMRGEENFEYICACVNKFGGMSLEEVKNCQIEIWVESKPDEQKVSVEE